MAKQSQRSVRFRSILAALGRKEALGLAIAFLMLGVQPVGAEALRNGGVDALDQPATTVTDWMAQIDASRVQITGVQLEVTETGLRVVLETTGALEAPATRVVGNALIADIPNAAIAEAFSQSNPIEGIALVSVSELPGDRVRVAITGTDAPPVAEVQSEGQTLVLGVAIGTAAGQGGEELQVVVTGEQDEDYNPSSASTATRTDTPLRDIPQSIQVVPRQVLEDRDVRNLNESVETVSGVSSSGDLNAATGGGRIIRGFATEGNFRNGFSQGGSSFDNTLEAVETIEQVEVLKGPASVLYGAIEPGGAINVITRQPLSEPYYNLEFEAGNYEFYHPSIDLSGPLTADDTLLYRFIASYQEANGFQDFVNTELTTIAPSITVNFSDRTSLNLYYEYIRFFADSPRSFVPLLSDGRLPPQNFYAAYPDLYFSDITTQKFGYTLEHELSDNWQIRNNVAVTLNSNTRNESSAGDIVDDRLLTGLSAFEGDIGVENYFGQIDLLGKFDTGSISHQLLVGFDIDRFYTDFVYLSPSTALPDLDILNPNYDIPRPEFDTLIFGGTTWTQSYGVYLQDQIAFSDNLKLLIGGRYDWLSSKEQPTGADQTVQNDGAFSPRLGLVYQPSDTVSLYASYSRSFRQSTGFNREGTAFEPSRGTQYEVGVKADLLDGELSTTLSAYRLTRTNVLTPDPDDPNFSVQTGEQRSQGIELDIGGEILPGWNVIASYTYTDAEVTEDTTTPAGNRLAFVPENQASLWTTYEIQDGDLRGLGVGLGLFYVGEREGDLANSFTVRDYLRTDAALYYRRGRLNAAINIRNLFDTNYVDFGYSRVLIQRANPLTIVGSVSWEF